MANERQVIRRIGAAKNISKITKAMEMVAASKMKKAQDQALAARPYAQALYDSIITLSEASKLTGHPLLSTHEAGKPVILVMSTDKGLCGALNTNILKELNHWKKEHRGGEVIAVGKKAVLAARSLDMTVHAQFTDLPEHIAFKDIVPIVGLVLDGFTEQLFSSVDAIYTDFINTLSQQPRTEQLLPIAKLIKPDVVQAKEETSEAKEILFEPSAQEILGSLLPFYLENTIFHYFLEARASEHSARMVAMKNASENAAELMDELKLIYNKTRQQNVTNEILDIISATMALN